VRYTELPANVTSLWVGLQAKTTFYFSSLSVSSAAALRGQKLGTRDVFDN